jgi:lipoprotein-anchoring transpeptidase ErfK/SrfK
VRYTGGVLRHGMLAVVVLLAAAVTSVTLARRAPDASGPGAEALAPSSLTTPPGLGIARTGATARPSSTGTAAPPTAEASPHGPRFPSTVAVARTSSTTIYDGPGGRVVSTLHSPARFSGMPQVFLVQPTPAPPGWLHVGLRTRPNGSTGWIRADEVTTDRHQWSIVIDLTRRWATVYDGPAVFAATPVVIGTDDSPTPEGDSFIVEAVWSDRPNGPYGPFIFGLSSHSDVYSEFGGGDGQVGLHGTNQPQLLGTAASNGCVRFPNDVILRMARALPMGVPVRVHR